MYNDSAHDEYNITFHLPIFIIPYIYITINSKPRSSDLRKESHHTVTLHVCITQVKDDTAQKTTYSFN